jgi:GT2 family glycosyltransferase/tetratricopeptide (TPR) repeat protein
MECHPWPPNAGAQRLEWMPVLTVPDQIEELIRRADHCRDDVDWLGAATFYGMAVEQDIGAADKWVQYAHLLKEAELFEAAVGAYQAAIRADGTDPDPRLHLAHLLKRLGRSAEALEAFEALSRLPDAPHVEQEIRGLRIALLQSERVQPDSFGFNGDIEKRDACLLGFARVQRSEAKRAAEVAEKNRDYDNRRNRKDLAFAAVLNAFCQRVIDKPLSVRLQPKANLVIRDNRFVATTSNPQFNVLFQGQPLRKGWFEIEIDIQGFSSPVDPLLYIEHSSVWATFSTFRLRPLDTGRLSAVGFCDGPVLRVRLDPVSREGAFTLRSFVIKQISFAKALRLAYRADPNATRSALRAGRNHRSGSQFSTDIAAILCWKPDRYTAWIAANEPKIGAHLSVHKKTVAGWTKPPLLSVVIDAAGGLSKTLKTLRSLEAQSYQHWQAQFVSTSSLPAGDEQKLVQLCEADARLSVGLADPRTMLSGAVRTLVGDFTMFSLAGDRFSPLALYRLAERIVAGPELSLIYSDEDCMDGRSNRHSPMFKPGWDPDYFFATTYLGRAVAIRTSLLLSSGREAWPSCAGIFDAILRVTEAIAADQIAHIPLVLYHKNAEPLGDRNDSLPQPMSEDHREALRASMSRRGQDVKVVEAAAGLSRLIWPLPDPAPLVTLIIPTRDRVDLLRGCIDSLLGKTAYSSFEVLIVDNGSREAETLAYFGQVAKRDNIRIIDVPGPFNFSRLNNLAVDAARGSVIGLINNDIQAIDDSWLGEMVSQAVRPEIGAVGAKLLYPTGHIQHAGVVCGIGLVAGHPHKFRDAEDPGYMGRLAVTQSFSAVTAACLVVEKAKYNEVGGLDSDNLPVAFNDVDLCLKLDAAGYRNLYTPYARLVHLESVTRGFDTSPEKVRRYRAEAAFMINKWPERSQIDPYYNINLTRVREDFSIGD